MARLTLSLLGPFHVTLDNRTVNNFAYDKVRALLAYLVVEADRPHRREALAELLWPEQPAATARHSLSQALTTLRQAIGDHHATPPYLLITREAVQFNLASDYVADVASFTALIDACSRHAHSRRATCTQCANRLEQAVSLYRGDFLAQFMIGDSASFEEWALLRREWLRQRALDALAWLSDHYEQRGGYEQASTYVQRQIALDPWQEDAYRRLMRMLARCGQRAAALRQYEQCRRMLAGELGIEPDEETTALYEQIRNGKLTGTGAAAHGKPGATLTAALPRHNLPAQTTPFVGREHEVAAIKALLADAHCRLITLVGPGGIGKTRLGLHVARSQVDAFAHGVCFVPFAPLRSAQQIVAAIAAALQLQFFGQDDPLDQLCAYLHEKQMVLVLDNVEHLLAGGPILTAILQAAPEVTILATSRERLNLHGEWVYEVEGLCVPEQDTLETIEGYSAVQLFVQSARRVQSHFELRAGDRRYVARICRLAGGMPLALELAAAWVMVLPCAEIAREIEKNLDFLATSVRDLPERHRSMRAVFDHSWSLLGERERRVFRKLSVFRGGFTRAAAEELADAALASLAALVAKSLLHRTPSGRYEVHELLRQYGEDKLHERPQEERQTRDRHAAYYTAFLGQREERLRGRDQHSALAEIVDELENVRSAWYWAAEHGDMARIAQALDSLWLFCASRGNLREAEALYTVAVRSLERTDDRDGASNTTHDTLLGKLYAGLASWHYRLGFYDRARSLLEHSIMLLRRCGAHGELAFALNHLAATSHLQGSYREEQALLHESIALSEASGERWLTGYSLNDLGLCTHLLGDDSEARRLCQESLAVFRAIDDLRGMGFALNNLGVIAAHQGDYVEAERLHHESLAIRRANDDRWGTAMSLTQLGVVARAGEHYGESRACLLDALRAAYDIRALPVAVDILVELARLAVVEGEHEQARRLLVAAAQHPALTPESRDEIEQLQAMAPTLLEAGLLAALGPRSIDALVAALLATNQSETPVSY